MPLAAFPKCFMEAICVQHTLSVEDWVRMAAENLDVDGLELFIDFVPGYSLAKLSALRNLATQAGLAIPMMCCSPDFTKLKQEQRNQEIEKEKKAIDAIVALGGQFCRVLSGQRRPNVSLEDGIRYAADCILECLPYAKDRGITLILENHYKDSFWDYPELAQKREAFLTLLEAVGEHENFGVNYDPSNAIVAGDDPIELLETIKHRVKTMHASDRFLSPGATLEDLAQIDAHPSQGYAPFLKHGVIGKGLNDYDEIFGILKGVGFQGWISIEDGQDPETGLEDLKLSAQFLRAKMRKYDLP